MTNTVWAEDPAVSAINGKIEALGGAVDGEGAGAALGSVTLPLGERFGLQADAAYGEIDGEELYGGGAHLFARDPRAIPYRPECGLCRTG